MPPTLAVGLKGVRTNAYIIVPSTLLPLLPHLRFSLGMGSLRSAGGVVAAAFSFQTQLHWHGASGDFLLVRFLYFHVFKLRLATKNYPVRNHPVF